MAGSESCRRAILLWLRKGSQLVSWLSEAGTHHSRECGENDLSCLSREALIFCNAQLSR